MRARFAATLSLAEDSMKDLAVHSLFMRRALKLMPLVAAVLSTTWACDPGKGVGTASEEKRAAAIEVPGTNVSVLLGNGDYSTPFDVVNPAFADPLQDSRGRLIGVHVLWTSSNPAIISVVTPDVPSSGTFQSEQRQYGAEVMLHPVAKGTATITGTVTGAPTLNDAPVTISITVTVLPLPTKVVATPNPVTVLTTGTAQLNAQAFSADGTAVDGNSEWVCGDTTIAMVGNFGGTAGGVCGRPVDPTNPSGSVFLIVDNRVVVYPKKVGTTFVVAKYHITLNGVPTVFSDTVRIVVSSGVSKVVVTPLTTNLVVGGTRQLSAQAFDLAGNALTGLPITWGSRNASVISVDATGTAKGLASGTGPGLTQSANAFATIAGVSGDATLTVYRTPGNVIVTPTPASVGIGQSLTLHAKLVDSDNTTQIPFSATAVTWKIDNTAFATMTQVNDSTATVTGVALGVTTARATAASGASGVSDVTVRAASTGGPATSMKITPATVTVKDGDTQQFTATLYDANGNVTAMPAGGTIGFNVDDSNIASVVYTSGLLSAYGTGTTFVRASLAINGVETNIFAAATLTVVPR
jgi:plastocyanin